VGPSEYINDMNKAIGATKLAGDDDGVWIVNCERISEMPNITFMIDGVPFTFKPQDRVGNTVWKFWSKS